MDLDCLLFLVVITTFSCSYCPFVYVQGLTKFIKQDDSFL